MGGVSRAGTGIICGVVVLAVGGCRSGELSALGPMSSDGRAMVDASAADAATGDDASGGDVRTRVPDSGAASGPSDASVPPANRDAGPDQSSPGVPGSVGPGFPSGTCPAAVPRFHLLAPLSASTVTTARPMLRFASDGMGADVQICQDRACSQIWWQTTVTGDDAIPSGDLSPGYWFWRARPAGTSDAAWTSAWLFRVRRRAPEYAPLVNTSAELFNDFNGDGYPDVVLHGQSVVSIYLGGPAGPSPANFVSDVGAFDASGFAAGPSVDLNGDGFTDFGAVHELSIPGGNTPIGMVQLSAPTEWSSGYRSSGYPYGFSFDYEVMLVTGPYPLPVAAPIGVGDLDGDGYGDLAWALSDGGWLVHGCAVAPAKGPWMPLGCGTCQQISTASGDFDGDGHWDVAWGDVDRGAVYEATGPVPGINLAGSSRFFAVDANGDGYSDLLTTSSFGNSAIVVGTPYGLKYYGLSGSSHASLPFQIDAVADLNGDGYWDTISWTAGSVLYGGSELWSFVRSASIPTASSGAVVDMNADGYDDLLLALPGGGYQYFAGSPDGLASQPVVIPGS